MPDPSERVIRSLAVPTLRPVAKREIAALGQHGLDRLRIATLHPLMVVAQGSDDGGPDQRIRQQGPDCEDRHRE